MTLLFIARILRNMLIDCMRRMQVSMLSRWCMWLSLDFKWLHVITVNSNSRSADVFQKECNVITNSYKRSSGNVIRLNFRLCSRITLFLPDGGICEEGVIGILYIWYVLHFYYLYSVICITYGLSLQFSSVWGMSLQLICECEANDCNC
jgi:hypothetical protein